MATDSDTVDRVVTESPGLDLSAVTGQGLCDYCPPARTRRRGAFRVRAAGPVRMPRRPPMAQWSRFHVKLQVGPDFCVCSNRLKKLVQLGPPQAGPNRTAGFQVVKLEHALRWSPGHCDRLSLEATTLKTALGLGGRTTDPESRG